VRKRRSLASFIPAVLLLAAGVACLPFVLSRLSVPIDERTVTRATPPRKRPPTEEELQQSFAQAQQALKQDDSVALEAILKRAPQVAKRKGKQYWTLLHFAAYQGLPTEIQLLISADSEVDARERDGFTPLHLAAQEGKAEAVRALIDFAFDDLDHDALQAGARVTNPASRRVLEKCGFQWTGVGLYRIASIKS